jgi:hypothetical protein
LGVTDVFPVDADFTVTRTKESNVLRAKVDSAREYFRQKAPPRRIFTLVFNRRSAAESAAIESFRLAHMADFFTWIDKSANRSYSCWFDTEPIYEEIGNQQVNIKCQLIEAAGMPMATYPSFASGNPWISIPVANAFDLGSDGMQFIYTGYGFRVNGTFTQIYLDETSIGGASLNEAVPLGLHRVRVVGGSPVSVDYLI